MFLTFVDTDRTIHSVKTALACLIGFAITKSLHFYVDQWLIVTIIVVMCAQISVGSMIKKSYMRFIGTLSGSLVALATLLFFAQNEMAFAIVITIAALFFSYIATGEKNYSEAGTLGAVTVVIILINKDPTPTIALERFLEISLGIFIAAVISQFILPIHASKYLREAQALTIRKLRIFYAAMLSADKGQDDQENYQKLDEDIALSLIKQRKLAADSVNEPLGKKFNAYDFKKILQAEKEILRSIAAMHYALRACINSDNVFSHVSVLQDFNENMALTFDKIADFIQSNNAKEWLIDIPKTEELKAYIALKERTISANEFIYLNSLLFAAEMLVTQMRKLAGLVSEIKK